jgi:hypothetical protein
MATRTVDGTSLYRDAIKRIQQLEALNATLAAQIDRVRPVVDAALVVARAVRETTDWTVGEAALEYAARVYQEHVAQLAKRAGEGGWRKS